MAIWYPMNVQSFNHSYFDHSNILFFITQFLIFGHGVIFTCDCNNLLKTYFVAVSWEKLPHALKLCFGNFYRAFKKSNNYVTTMLISAILMLFELWSHRDIYEQFGSLLLGISIFVLKQLVNLLQIGAIALWYLLFFDDSSWITII